jgi:hypothetical protein
MATAPSEQPTASSVPERENAIVSCFDALLRASVADTPSGKSLSTLINTPLIWTVEGARAARTQQATVQSQVAEPKFERNLTAIRLWPIASRHLDPIVSNCHNYSELN